MEQVCHRDNLDLAYKRVKSNKGAAGVDQMRVAELGSWIRSNKKALIGLLLKGSYQPQLVRGVKIPKPGGKGKRQLGIPTVVDRLVQQAILQVLGPILERGFSESSFKELERRGHRFCRHADDCNRYVQSLKAGQRVMASISQFLEKRLKLYVNRDKSAVAIVQERKFLGYRLFRDGSLGISSESLKTIKTASPPDYPPQPSNPFNGYGNTTEPFTDWVDELLSF